MHAGGEDKVIIKLIKAGSLDPDALADATNSPEGKLHQDMEAHLEEEEEKKEPQ